MPRFIMSRLWKAPLSSKRIYEENNLSLNFLVGFGVDHNILLYESNKETEEFLNKNKCVKDLVTKVKVNRKFWNIEVIYDYLYNLSNNTSIVSNEPLPEYNEVKNIIFRNVYDKSETNLLYNKANNMLYGIEPEKITNFLFVGGTYNIETSISMESVMNDIGEDKALIDKVVEYYALCSEVYLIEDNPLYIEPYEYSRYLPTENGGITDKEYQIKALKALGLSTGFINSWKETKDIKTVVTIEWEEDIYGKCYPPISGYDPELYPNNWNEFGDDEFYE